MVLAGWGGEDRVGRVVITQTVAKQVCIRIRLRLKCGEMSHLHRDALKLDFFFKNFDSLLKGWGWGDQTQLRATQMQRTQHTK